MLLGRDPEIDRIRRALAQTHQGVSSTLVFRGDPGIGKTVLLRQAAQEAAGMLVLSAQGVAFETEMPLSGLHELLRPALGVLGRIPRPLAVALRSAFGLGERVPSDRLVIGAATLELLTAYAQTPLLVLLDDAQWLDRASAEALAFSARRLLADPIALLVAVREGETSPFLESGFEELLVSGLDETSAVELLQQSAPTRLPAQVADRIIEVTAGNPLALVEFAAEADRLDTVAGYLPLPIPVLVSLERTFLRRANGISEAARSVLLLLAAAGSGGLELVRRALPGLGIGAEAVEEAEAVAGLVSGRGDGLTFVHPLAAAAIYHAASAAQRRGAHRALAAAIGDQDADRQVWHLAAAAGEADEPVAVALEAAAERAEASGGHAAAAAALEEAARLSESVRGRSRRLLAAAESDWLAGEAQHAVQLLGDVSSTAGSGELTPDVEVLAGRIALVEGRVEEGFQLIRRAIGEIAARDRVRAIRLLSEAGMTGLGAGRVGDMLTAGRRALDLLGPDDPHEVRIAAHAAYGCAAVLAGLGEEGPGHLRTAQTYLRGIELGGRPLLMLCAGLVGLFLREAGGDHRLIDMALAGARARAPASALPMVLFYLGRDLATTDQWTAARAHYEEGVHLARESNQYNVLCGNLAGLAQLDALEGRWSELEIHSAEAGALSARFQMGFFQSWLLAAQALKELGSGQAEAALDPLRRLSMLHAELGIRDPDLDPTPDLIEVQVRLGRQDVAAAEAQAFRRSADAKGQPFALARAERSLGLAAPDPAFWAHFETALSLHARTGDAFEIARTRLCYGERLRRSRRRAQARRQLAEALEGFERLGAIPWQRRALIELGATGEVLGRRDETIRHRLTPQELQVAVALAEGRTTREAAAMLYLSPKTVEYHLRNVYDKLDIRSREELHAVIGTST